MSDDLIKRSDVWNITAILHSEFITIEQEQILERIDEMVDGLPPADRPQEWIPCSERLPNRQGYYICTCKDGSKYKRTTTVKWSNGWQLTGSRAYWVVVAWMPLPEPWKGADDE